MFDFSIRRTLSIALTLISVGALSPVAANAIDDKKVASDMLLIFDELIVLRTAVTKLDQRVKTLEEKEKALKEWQEQGDTYIFVPTNSVQPEQPKLESPECRYEKNAPWVLKEVK